MTIPGWFGCSRHRSIVIAYFSENVCSNVEFGATIPSQEYAVCPSQGTVIRSLYYESKFFLRPTNEKIRINANDIAPIKVQAIE